MSKNGLLFIVVLAPALAAGACGGGSPTGPTPTAKVCEDPAARNPGQPLPCAYPIAPVLKTLEIRPPSGSTVRYSYSSDTNVTVEWVYDPYIPGRVAVSSYLSADCEKILPYTGSGVVAEPRGRRTFHPGSPEKHRGITQTSCVINQIEVVDADWKVLEVVTREVVPWVFHFTEGELSGAAPGGK